MPTKKRARNGEGNRVAGGGGEGGEGGGGGRKGAAEGGGRRRYLLPSIWSKTIYFEMSR